MSNLNARQQAKQDYDRINAEIVSLSKRAGAYGAAAAAALRYEMEYEARLLNEARGKMLDERRALQKVAGTLIQRIGEGKVYP